MIMNPPVLQNSSERVTALAFAPGADFATAVALRRMATANGVTSFYLLAPAERCGASGAAHRRRLRASSQELAGHGTTEAP